MKKRQYFSILTLLMMGVFLAFVSSCEKESNGNENQIIEPVVSFIADTTEIISGETVQFSDLSANIPTSWNWDFGDGTTSAEQNPSHTYANYGIYTVTLTATNGAGSDILIKPDYITVKKNIAYGQFIDNRDGKTYKTIQIGNQVWMAENLNYEPSSGYWIYDNDFSYASTYGLLYNWETANNVCPSGWHLPSDTEWKQLEMYIGMSQSDADNTDERGTNEGTKLKATYGWSANGNGTDEYGFTALPGGMRNSAGYFFQAGLCAYFWSSTEDGSFYACYRSLSYNTGIYRSNTGGKGDAFYVRCIKD